MESEAIEGPMFKTWMNINKHNNGEYFALTKKKTKCAFALSTSCYTRKFNLGNSGKKKKQRKSKLERGEKTLHKISMDNIFKINNGNYENKEFCSQNNT